MTSGERNNIVALANGAFVLAYLIWLMRGMSPTGQTDTQIFTYWARSVLWVIPISIVASILMTILVTMIYAAATNNPNPSFVVDERDRAISMFGMQVTLSVIAGGFILSLIALAIGWHPFTVMNLILSAFVMGDICGNIAKQISYRRGF